MNLRWQLFVVALLLCPLAVKAQNIVVAPVVAPPVGTPMGAPMPAPMGAPMMGPDPYAMVSSPSNAYGWGNGFAIPTTSCIRDRFWFSLDYLVWWSDGMDVVPLATTSPLGTAPGDAGTLGRSDTTVLYGGSTINDGSNSGSRFRSGYWFRQGAWALESEFFKIKGSTQSFGASSDGSSILARPYYDIDNGQQASLLVSYPGLVAGTVAASSTSELRSGLINARISFIPVGMLGCNDGCDPPDRVDWIVGYRALELKEQLSIGHSLTSLSPAVPDTTNSGDYFATKNKFSGLQLGMIYQAHFRRVTMESLLRVALGNNRKSASIRGNTTITDAGVTNTYTGGLLAQRSNIGNFEESDFTMVPELGINFAFRVTRCFHLTLGYNLIYFPNVLRASEQIDPDVNPELIPVEAALVSGPLRPRYRAITGDYWANGLNFGVDFRF